MAKANKNANTIKRTNEQNQIKNIYRILLDLLLFYCSNYKIVRNLNYVK